MAITDWNKKRTYIKTYVAIKWMVEIQYNFGDLRNVTILLWFGLVNNRNHYVAVIINNANLTYKKKRNNKNVIHTFETILTY